MSAPQKIQASTSNSVPSFTGDSWRERPNADKIPCPALLSLYNNGFLNPDVNGNVSTANLDTALASVGVSTSVRQFLVKSADGTDKAPESFNLFELRGSNLDHKASTGISDQGVDSKKQLVDAVLKFSENGRMYAAHFAVAANKSQLQDPDFKGTLTQTVEFTALLEVFGRIDDNKNRYLTVDDVEGLWIDGRFPKDWKPRAADEINPVPLSVGVIDMIVKRLWDKLTKHSS
jgi:hypothetical protein